MVVPTMTSLVIFSVVYVLSTLVMGSKKFTRASGLLVRFATLCLTRSKSSAARSPLLGSNVKRCRICST